MSRNGPFIRRRNDEESAFPCAGIVLKSRFVTQPVLSEVEGLGMTEEPGGDRSTEDDRSAGDDGTTGSDMSDGSGFPPSRE